MTALRHRHPPGFHFTLLAGLVLLGAPLATAAPERNPATPRGPEQVQGVGRLLGAALAGEGVFDLARGLSDHVGPRLAGSPGAAAAVRWALDEMRRAGLQNVRAEAVQVPRWERGPRAAEGARVLGPGGVRQELAVTALGGSIGTQGTTAEVVEAQSFDELKRLGRERVAGKIVLWNVVLQRGEGGMTNYGDVAKYRSAGPSEAAKLGAVGTLVRSLGLVSYRLPHTGAMRYADGVQRIPAAAIAAEDAELLHRLLQEGPVRVQLSLPCQTLGEVAGANVVGEVPGGTAPQEIVVLGAHLDSWDLGTGAVDDAAGVAIVLGAARAMVKAGLVPRRTVRVVLFANEENGLKGAKGYAAAHQAELGRHVAALEADSGAGAPRGFATPAPAGVVLLQGIAAALRGLGAERVTQGDYGGADLSPIEDRVPMFHLMQEGSRYFEWHHTAADTLDKIEPVALNLSAAALAVAAYGLADSEGTLPRPAAAPAAAK